MKKTLSWISAIAMLTATLPLHAAAYAPYIDVEHWNTTASGAPWELHNDGFNRCRYRALNWYREHEFIAVTTAEGLPEISDPRYRTVLEWEDFAAQQAALPTPEGTYLNTQPLYDTYGEDIRLYYVWCDPYCTTPYTDCRSFAMEHDTVLDTLLLEERDQGDCYWDGTYISPLSQELTAKVLNGEDAAKIWAEVFSKDSALAEARTAYQAWEPAYAEWVSAHAEDALSPAEEMQALALAGIASPWTITAKAFEAADAFYAAHPDEVACVIPNLTTTSVIWEYRTFSAWEHVGDLNEDAEVNASDAAQILMAAAMQGAGNDSGLTIEEQQFADVNADGVFNASDAALVLQYAAAAGADPEIDGIQGFVQGRN